MKVIKVENPVEGGKVAFEILKEKLKFLLGLGIQKRLAKVQLSNIFSM